MPYVYPPAPILITGAGGATSADAIIMADGTTLQQTLDSMQSLLKALEQEQLYLEFIE